MMHRFGCKKSPVDDRDFVLMLSTSHLLTGTKLPPMVDLRSIGPPVYNQGDLGSCVSNGIAYCVQHDQIKRKLLHQFMPSRLFIYYNTRVLEGTVDEDSGTTIRGALMAANKKGVCPETIWPYLPEQYRHKPSNEAYSSGLQHLVNVYARIQLDLEQMKQCLANGYPFVFGARLYPSFELTKSDGIVNMPKPKESMLGGHCMTCLGYDDARQVFIVRNSWGHKWGDHGFCYIPYAFMTNHNYVFDVWTIRSVTDTETHAGVDDQLSKVKMVVYGKDKKYIDVTTTFKNFFNSGQNALKISNNHFGDPNPGVLKELRVTLTNNSVMVYPEGDTVRLTDLIVSTEIVQANRLSRAIYGKNDKYYDVTEIVRNQYSQGNSHMTVSNALFGDPCPHVAKELQITLTNGVIKTFKEDQIVEVNQLVA